MIDLKNHVLFQEANAIKKFCAPLIHLSIDGFIFTRRFANGEFIDLSNNLEWSENYLTRYLQYKIDLQNALEHMFIGPGISLWSQNPNNTIWKEGREKWGFHSGISISKEGPRWTDAFYFYSREPSYKMDQEYLRNFSYLDKFNQLFIEKFQNVIWNGEKNPLVSPAAYLQKANEKNLLENQQKFIKSLANFSESLSMRELECIYYAAKGNTALQISKLLHLSRRTVETHLKNAKEKLQVTRTSDLIKLFPEW